MTKIIYFTFIIIISFSFTSCSMFIHKKAATSAIVIYPTPPDTARIQFLTKITYSSDVVKKQSWFKKYLLGKEASMSIYKPYGIAIKNGKIYIADMQIQGLEVIDLEKGSFEYFNPTGKGQLKQPINCTVDDNGYLYVTDLKRLEIVVFDEKGNYVRSFGEKENFKPTDVFYFENKLWVTNFTGHAVYVYNRDSTNNLLYTIPDTSYGTWDHLFSPSNLSVNGEKVCVSDFGDFRMKLFTHDGHFLDTIGSNGDLIGMFGKPKGVALDRESNLYVVDAAFENVQIFDKEGNLLMFFGGHYNGPGDMWLPAKVIVDYDNISYFQKYVDPSFDLKYIILVVNQYGPDKINIYGRIEPAKQKSIEIINDKKKVKRKKDKQQEKDTTTTQ